MFSLDVINKEKFTVGKHRINVQAVDANGLSSNILDYDVTITSANPVLSTSNPNLTITKSTEAVNIPATVTYDGVYKFSNNDLTWHMKVTDELGNTVYKDDVSSAIHDEFTEVIKQDFVQPFSIGDLGITESGKYKIIAYVEDNSKLSSKPVTYNLTYISKSSTLVYDKDYSFQDVNSSNESKIVNRSGKWKLGVNSVDTGWTLTARASQLNNTDVNGHIINTLNGNMIFVDQSNVVHDLSSDSPTLIGYQNDQTTNDFDISSHWKPNQGILLKLQPNPLKGKYTGTISWTLKNTL
ncbi:hypothetical protein [Companilactobacillus hulinensis]|uniref:hypothetical protein n=1 Tax=Companilactobacillus hulinensis TaxID=2486007 RepID=UPI000F789672|nr:hypothetical protein [Companilactobacillus hulinensis]